MTQKTTILATTAIALAAMCSVEAKTQPSKQKNVLLIIVDDLGWNDLGFMGSTFHESPNVDALAASGLVFTDAYSACQVSSPSRASIMTGQYTTRHGVTDWIGEASGTDWRKQRRHSKTLPADYEWNLNRVETLLPQYMKDGGYRTFFAGKWHLGENESDWPEMKGFDINVGGWASGGPKGGYFAPYINPRMESGADGENLSMRLANETSAFIENHSKSGEKSPFFAVLSFYAVHGAIETTQENWRYFRDKAVDSGIAPVGFQVDRTLPIRQNQDNPVYAGLIRQMDDAVGRVITTLEELGYDENTMVIFTSDNGGVVAGDNFSTSLKPLRGGKGYQFEGGIRVPMVVRLPGSTMNGERCSTPVVGTDIFATIASYAGVKIPKSHIVDCVDILPLTQNKSIAERPLFWHYPHYGNQGGEPSSIIRDGDWKLIYYHEDLRCELYNLAIDLSESEPLNIQYPEMVESLKVKLMEWLTSTSARMPAPDMEYDPKAEAAVKQKWRTNTLKQKEAERQNMLCDDFEPNADWWGSKVTID